MTSTVTVALDWTPNVNHTGFLLAAAFGEFEKQGINVKFMSPHVDGYKVTPAQKVVQGVADIAICPSETVISYACQSMNSTTPKLKAVAAVLARDTSAIVTTSESGIDRPAKLDGKKYASYGARFEGRIVQQMIRNDGGKGDFDEDAEEGMLNLWDLVLTGKAAATWVFMGWEGVIARRKGISLNVFKLDDYQIEYGYSPVMVISEAREGELGSKLSMFMKAAAAGWAYASQNPEDAAKKVTAYIAEHFSDLPEPVEEAVLLDALKYVQDAIAAPTRPWGAMEADRTNGHQQERRVWHYEFLRWDKFLDWLSESGLLTTKKQSRHPQNGEASSLQGLLAGDVGEPIPRDLVSSASLFTNSYIPSSI